MAVIDGYNACVYVEPTPDLLKSCLLYTSENEFYIIKAPNGKVLEVKNFNTENGAAIQLWSYAGHPWQMCIRDRP